MDSSKLIALDLAALPTDTASLKSLLLQMQAALKNSVESLSASEARLKDVNHKLFVATQTIKAQEEKLTSMRTDLTELSISAEANEEFEFNTARVLSDCGIPPTAMPLSARPTNKVFSRTPAAPAANVESFGSFQDPATLRPLPGPGAPQFSQAAFTAGSLNPAMMRSSMVIGSPVQSNPFGMPGALSSRSGFSAASGLSASGNIVGSMMVSNTSQAPEGFTSGSLTIQSRRSMMSSSTSPPLTQPMQIPHAGAAPTVGNIEEESDEDDEATLKIRVTRDD